mmetsp:Transcript_56196/g.99713  ORF Transcript_56196/g.99713 Transcript_56196/m.99713 type:complete len:449 (+) Transcript_56196:88-1434(+)
MAGVVLPDLKACAPDFYFLNLAGTDRFSWRLRSEPCMNADEIAEFYHGDRIKAVRDVCHPGWLKLVDKPGWVKEAHEEQLVWKTAQSQPSSQVMDLEPSSGGCKDAKLAGKDASKCSAGVSEGRDASKCSAKLSAEDISDISPSSACSNGSRTSPCPTAHAHALSPALPRFFTGKSCSIGDGENSHAVVTGNIVPTRWFTGQSCKIDLMPFERSSTMDKKPAMRPRWADMEDTDEEDMSSTPVFRKIPTEQSFDEKHLEIQLACMPCSDQPNQSIVENTPEVDTIKVLAVDEPCAEPLDGKHHDAQFLCEPSSNEQVVLKPKRQKRNRELLQRRNKTKMCQYMTNEGACAFGDSCWFAHSASDLKDQGDAEKEIDPTPPPPAKVQDEEVHHSEKVVQNPGKQKRNKALLKKRNKTEFCRYLQDKGCCPFSETCWFAHSAEEIRTAVST